MNNWPHSPAHRLEESGAYMVTAATYQKARLFADASRLDFFQGQLFELSHHYKWDLQAWAILPNHYHFVALSPAEPSNLQRLIGHLHTLTAREVNRIDSKPGRRVWYQYWDSNITFERSFFARLKYVHFNAVHHGLVKKAVDYKWCSAGWFETKADRAFYKRITSLNIDSVKAPDDF